MKEIELKIDGDKAVGSFEVARAEGAPAVTTLLFQSMYTREDDTTIWTEPGSVDARFSAARETPSEAEAGEAVALETGDTFRIVRTLKLMSVIADLRISKDGKHLYALDLSEGRVCKIETGRLTIEAEAPVVEDAVGMALTPNGETLYVVARDPSVNSFYGDAQRGKIQTFSAKDLKLEGTADVEASPSGVVATDTGLLVMSVYTQGSGIVVVEADGATVLGSARAYGNGSIRLSPDQTRVYAGDWGLSPADYRCVVLDRPERGSYEMYDSPHHGDYPLGGDFEISADGKFLVGSRGSVLRLSKNRGADLKYVTSIDPFLSAATAPGCNTFFTATDAGFIKQYSLGTFEVEKSVKIDRRLSRLLLDPKHRVLYGVASRTREERSSWTRTPSVGDWTVQVHRSQGSPVEFPSEANPSSPVRRRGVPRGETEKLLKAVEVVGPPAEALRTGFPQALIPLAYLDLRTVARLRRLAWIPEPAAAGCRGLARTRKSNGRLILQ